MQPQLTRGMVALLNTVFVADLAAARAVANAYRETWGHTGGVVVVFKNEAQDWVNELRNPESWAPGCVAVAATLLPVVQYDLPAPLRHPKTFHRDRHSIGHRLSRHPGTPRKPSITAAR